MNYYDYLYCRFYKFDTYKVRTNDTIRLSASVTLSLLIGINILTIIIAVSLLIHKTLIKGALFGLTLAIILFTINFLKFKKQYVLNILKEWEGIDYIKKKRINFLISAYIILSIFLFLVGIILLSVIKTKYGDF